MMKVKVLVRNPDHYVRETKRDIHKAPRNFDPSLHPFEVGREYQRAVNAAKLDRVFAAPFLCALDGHTDGVHCMGKHPHSLSTVLSGSYNGEVRVWNLSTRSCVRSCSAHTGYVRGITVTSHTSGEPDQLHHFYTVGDDKCIKRWSFDDDQPQQTILTKGILTGISHQWGEPRYATSGSQCHVWDEERAEPVNSYTWGSLDTLTTVSFNPIEKYLLSSTGSDRSIIFYDIRGQTPVRKVVLEMRSNRVAWNPMEAFTFTAANEDYNLYTFDMRYLSRALNIHMDHVSAVMDVDYSPTGREFVSGSFDKTVRIFNIHQGRSREVYYTKRMQRVMCVHWSLDNNYILSGSDEMNLRLWKANAAQKLGPLSAREAESLSYSESLRHKFSSHPEVRRITRHRHVPKEIYHASREINTMKQSRKKKEANRRAHTKASKLEERKNERSKHVVNEHH